VSTVIEEVAARRLFDSRGGETLEVDVLTVAGFGRASAPAGASRGRAEAVPYPEGGVDGAVRKVGELIAPELIGLDADDQEAVDRLLHEVDGTGNFGNIGGNTACAVSLAAADAAADSQGISLYRHLAGSLAQELPHPLGNVLGGGRHAGGKAPDLQEFLSIPLEAETFSEAAEANVKVHQRVRSLLQERDIAFTGGRGDEGAWAPNLDNQEALEVVAEACRRVSEETGVRCGVGVDVAASSLWDPGEGCYVYRREGVRRSPGEQLDLVRSLVERYRLVYVEDPLQEEDFRGFAELRKGVRGCLICGDDLFATSRKRLARGVKAGSANAIIIKVNQVGTLTDAWETAEAASRAGYTPVMSHRSGETTDTHLAHLAVAFHCPIIKTGVVGGERTAKINELIRIEETLGGRARLATLTI